MRREATREEVRAGNPALAAHRRERARLRLFLLDPDGVIVYWGERAHLMKWWTLEEAEGAHLHFLYIEGGSEDGTAEEHLRQSAESGEYVGEGQRVRRDGSTFLGQRHVDGARVRAEEEAEFEREHSRGSREYNTGVLEPELADERARRAEAEAERGREYPSPPASLPYG